jgi:hypothetical protein
MLSLRCLIFSVHVLSILVKLSVLRIICRMCSFFYFSVIIDCCPPWEMSDSWIVTCSLIWSLISMELGIFGVSFFFRIACFTRFYNCFFVVGVGCCCCCVLLFVVSVVRASLNE